MPDPETSRREFLHSSGTLVGGAWLAFNLPVLEETWAHARRAARERLPFTVLTADEARELEAMAEQIFPGDDTAGARDAGVIHFLDRAFETWGAPMLEMIRAGLGDVATAVRRAHPGAEAFSDLPFDEGTAILEEVERTPFFGTLRFLVVAGLFSDPSHGGNRDGSGWAAMGFMKAPAWAPPFGFYDAEQAKVGGAGGGA